MGLQEYTKEVEVVDKYQEDHMQLEVDQQEYVGCCSLVELLGTR